VEFGSRSALRWTGVCDTTSDDTSRRLRDALEDRARDGRPHMAAKRAYGYARDAVSVIEDEAAIIREIYARCLDGTSPDEVPRELNERGEVTGSGKLWQPYAVRSVLDSRHVTGARVFRGQDAGRLARDHRPGHLE
jgi:site-specific DNA recombinase